MKGESAPSRPRHQKIIAAVTKRSTPSSRAMKQMVLGTVQKRRVPAALTKPTSRAAFARRLHEMALSKAAGRTQKRHLLHGILSRSSADGRALGGERQKDEGLQVSLRSASGNREEALGSGLRSRE
eukprot:CAMPEP_0170595182 /NCGR_PEP_ID=MMETSP0224-20130122/14415_1 /TAXON_ID=285029 /ORGANISM="Togula jolla, Strain CCCM 725" /LENGTH=125 /DNA_ID=CAMNT_0010919325 /DNA_START=61 /DNA_END=439 /DNA_ORIENTATION=+